MSDPVARLNAALEGRYAIERELGEGGMATVYLAHDVKHERQVALKVLKPELAAVVGAERFLAEIKTTANLQHPHILPLHDSGEADGFLFYVMPYVEGETLRDRIDREKQLPVDVAVRIATDVAEALHAAHEQGVIHRDIKPANILLSRDRPLVADFGIALAVSAAGGGRMTETGLSMGTPFYMSPEQAAADREPTATSDVYSLGCVLYEMLVGEPPHVGSSAQAVLVKVLTDEAPAPTRARPAIPAHVDATIRKSLEKLPADRFPTAQAFARALADPGFRHGVEATSSAAAGAGPWKRLALAAVAVAIVSVAAAGWALVRPTPPGPVARFASPFLPGQELYPGGDFDISADGSLLAYIGRADGNTGEATQVWLRRLQDLEARPLPGTEGALGVELSPDGTEVAFGGQGGLRALAVAGGPSRDLMPTGRRARWATDGHLYVYGPAARGVVRVPESGGEPQLVLERRAGQGFLFLDEVLPNGQTALGSVGSNLDEQQIVLWDLESQDRHAIAAGQRSVYVEPGYLVVLAVEGTLFAGSFDAGSGELRGALVPVLEDVDDFVVSDNGTLAYTQGASRGGVEFVWVDREGRAERVSPGWTVDAGFSNRGFDLSRDESRIVLTTDGSDPGSQDIWVKELPDGPMQRVTAGEGQSWTPRWVGTSDSITYTSGVTGGRATLRQRADLLGVPDTLFDGSLDAPGAQLSPDGTWLVLRVGREAGETRYIAAMRTDTPGASPELILGREYNALQPALSPDGQLLAYASDESGRLEVYVRPFPDVDSDGAQVSTAGGSQPVWSEDGRELFFVNGPGEMTVAEIEATPRVGVASREPLFTIPPDYRGFPNTVSTNFDVTTDGQRFLMARAVADDASSESVGLIIVQNWIEEVKQLLGN